MAKTKQTGRLRAQAKARANGYTGKFPPPPVRMHDADDAQEAIDRVDAGEHRSRLFHRLGARLADFSDTLSADHFRRFGDCINRALADPKNTPRAKLRAAEAGIRVLVRITEVMNGRTSRGQRVAPVGTESFEKLLAFLDTIDTSSLADAIDKLATGPGRVGRDARVRALDTLLRLVDAVERARAALQDCAGDFAEGGAEDASLAQARGEMAQLKEEAKSHRIETS